MFVYDHPRKFKCPVYTKVFNILSGFNCIHDLLILANQTPPAFLFYNWIFKAVSRRNCFLIWRFRYSFFYFQSDQLVFLRKGSDINSAYGWWKSNLKRLYLVKTNVRGLNVLTGCLCFYLEKCLIRVVCPDGLSHNALPSKKSPLNRPIEVYVRGIY